MQRKVSHAHDPAPQRVPRHSATPPQPYRTPRMAAVPDLSLPIAWNFGRMDPGGKFRCTLTDLQPHTAALVKLEGMPIGNLLEKRHNHPMATGKLSPEARRRLESMNLEEETLFQLDLGTPVRLWGILERNIFHILWLDLDHSVYMGK